MPQNLFFSLKRVSLGHSYFETFPFLDEHHAAPLIGCHMYQWSMEK